MKINSVFLHIDLCFSSYSYTKRQNVLLLILLKILHSFLKPTLHLISTSEKFIVITPPQRFKKTSLIHFVLKTKLFFIVLY